VKLKPFKQVPGWIALSVIALVCLTRCLQPDFFERLERMTFDLRAREAVKFPSPIAPNLGFVFIDEESIRAVWNGSLGFHFGLSWPRQVYGRLVQELDDQGAKAVAFDVIFGELRGDHPPVQMADDRLMESDDFFAMQMRRSSNVILAVTKQITPPALFLTNALAAGDITTEKDPDGILRRVQIFRIETNWHAVFRKAETDYGIDLSRARLEPGRLVLPRREGDAVKVPLDKDGNFDLADFIGDNIPAGMTRKNKPFSANPVWHLGVVLAAQELKLDLAKV